MVQVDGFKLGIQVGLRESQSVPEGFAVVHVLGFQLGLEVGLNDSQSVSGGAVVDMG